MRNAFLYALSAIASSAFFPGVFALARDGSEAHWQARNQAQGRLSWDQIEQLPKLQTNQLSALSSDGFVRFSHPYFPKHSARIKKAGGFCDGTVG